MIVEENAASVPHRFNSMLSTVYACGEYDKMLNGVFENFLEVKFKDTQLRNVTHGLEWFCYFDCLQQHILHSQLYQVMAYMPYTFVMSHLLFASLTKAKLAYPHTSTEKKNALNRNNNLLETMVSEMVPQARQFASKTGLVRDILPNLMEIIQPNLRPVNTQLYSARAKDELKSLVTTMFHFNLNYQQVRSQEGQYQYK